MRECINWNRIDRAIQYYINLGYKYIEVPWTIERDHLMITCPEGYEDLIAGTDQCLLGSAEQAFISMDLNGLLLPNKYVACSPCFRKEPTYDALHHRSFMKVELYQNYDVDGEDSLTDMVNDAFSVFQHLLRNSNDPNLNIVDTGENMFDINYNDIELGSYGIRNHNDLHWIYGTGLAEPRFTTAISF